MEKIRISKDQPLNPGDRIELHFKSTGMAWLKSVQIVLLENKLKNRKDWEIISWETPADQPTLLIMRIEIKSDKMQGDTELQTAGTGAVITCAAIAAVIIAGGIVYKLTLQETFLTATKTIEKVVESPEGKIAVAGTGIGIASAGIAALILLFLPKK